MNDEESRRSGPLEFLSRAQKDPKISASVKAAVEKSYTSMADEVMRIAREAGYRFTKEEFQSEVRRSIESRFAAGDKNLADLIGTKAATALESSCAKGCLSYTKSWHPDEVASE